MYELKTEKISEENKGLCYLGTFYVLISSSNSTSVLNCVFSEFQNGTVQSWNSQQFVPFEQSGSTGNDSSSATKVPLFFSQQQRLQLHSWKSSSRFCLPPGGTHRNILFRVMCQVAACNIDGSTSLVMWLKSWGGSAGAVSCGNVWPSMCLAALWTAAVFHSNLDQGINVFQTLNMAIWQYDKACEYRFDQLIFWAFMHFCMSRPFLSRLQLFHCTTDFMTVAFLTWSRFYLASLLWSVLSWIHFSFPTPRRHPVVSSAHADVASLKLIHWVSIPVTSFRALKQFQSWSSKDFTKFWSFSFSVKMVTQSLVCFHGFLSLKLELHVDEVVVISHVHFQSQLHKHGQYCGSNIASSYHRLTVGHFGLIWLH